MERQGCLVRIQIYYKTGLERRGLGGTEGGGSRNNRQGTLGRTDSHPSRCWKPLLSNLTLPHVRHQISDRPCKNGYVQRTHRAGGSETRPGFRTAVHHDRAGYQLPAFRSILTATQHPMGAHGDVAVEYPVLGRKRCLRVGHRSSNARP